MIVSKENLKKELKTLALFLGASVVQGILMCRGCSTYRSYLLVVLFTFLMWTFLYRGNSLLTDYISKRISWITFPLRRFFVGLAGVSIYSFLVIALLILVFESLFNFSFGSSLQFVIWVSVIFTVIISLFLHSRAFLLHWKGALVEAEKFQRERISARYESLKSKVNPLMLNNSLQTLGNLIHTDKERAVKFIKQLSEVYRYILDTRDRELVTSHEELRFLRSFLFLVESRFGTSVNVNVALDQEEFFLSPLSLQLITESLIENTHFSKDKPMTVGISIERDEIHIGANVAWMGDAARERVLGILREIGEQYNLLSSRAVRNTITDHNFSCFIPVIREEKSNELIFTPPESPER